MQRSSAVPLCVALAAISLGACSSTTSTPADAGVTDGRTTDGAVAGFGTVTGKISVAPNIFPAPPGDQAGSVVVALLDAPPDLGGQPLKTVVLQGDLKKGPLTYTFDRVPAGRYLAAAFLDDNGNFSAEKPLDAGDLTDSLMVSIEVAPAKTVTADLLLDSPVPPETPVCGLGALDGTKRRCVFDFIWNHAKRNYPFFALKGVDWDAVKKVYEPELDKPATDREFHQLVARLLAELKDGHSFIRSVNSAFGRRVPVAGVRLALLDGAAYVERLESGSAAESAGLKVGDRIVTVDGKTFAEHETQNGKLIPRPNDAGYHRTLLQSWLSGEEGSKAALKLERDNLALSIPRAAPPAPSGPILTSQRLAGTSGKSYAHLRVRTFQDAKLVGELKATFEALKDAKGLILDLRENPGGESSYRNALLAYLLPAVTTVARDYHRGTPEAFVEDIVVPAQGAFTGPLVVLTDEGSYSNGHLAPTILKALGRAKLVGRTTGGGSGTVEFWPLTAELTLGLDYAAVTTPSGTLAEELGTKPDIEVAQTAADVKAGLYASPGLPAKDVTLQRALKELGD